MAELKVNINDTYKRIVDILDASEASPGKLIYNGQWIEEPEKFSF